MGDKIAMELYGYAVNPQYIKSPTSVDESKVLTFEEFAFWHNNHKLCNYFSALWFKRGGGFSQFSCCYLPLTKQDIYDLIEELPLNKGEMSKLDRKFCMDALEYIKAGKSVIISTWG